MKYIIEIKPEYEGTTKGIIVLGIKNNCLCVDELAIEELEELNAEYINNHFPDITKKVDEAYQRGLEDGKQTAVGAAELREKLEYQRGLNDAWEAARKIAQQWEEDTDTEHRLVIDDSISVTLDSMTASEAIEKLKAYEEKQKADDKIEVGDEVIVYGRRGVVTYVHEILYTVMMHDGSCGNWGKGELKKTGKKHDIDKILEAMEE